MMKLQVRVVVGGKKYKLREEVKQSFKKVTLTLGTLILAASGFTYALASNTIDEDAVKYEEVYIGDGISTAASAISLLNEDVSYQDLLHLFEEANGIESAGDIHAGTYLVPVVEGK